MDFPSESFIDLLERFGDAHPPRLRYQPGSDVGTWQSELLTALQTLRGPLPERLEPTVETLESVEEANHTRHTVRIQVSTLSSLIAYLLVPHGIAAGEKRAGLIVSHGHAAHGIDTMCGLEGMNCEEAWLRAYALPAVTAGYVVLTPSWWGWKGRDGHLHRVGKQDRCNMIQIAASMYGINVLDLHIQDGQAAVDVLAARADVDPQRIGCIGNSYGGRTTMWLTVFEPRIRACVAAGCMNTFRERSLKLASCGIQYLFGTLRYCDVHEIFSLIAPRPMQLQAGKQDKLVTPADRDAIYATVLDAYQSLDAADNLDYQLHPEGHILLWDLAEPFLKKHLSG